MYTPDNSFEFKKIHDPVHGTIGLSELEVEILDTKVFQRLRNIKQLGLTNYVFPGAEYNRFSHSLGVCHLCGKLYDAKSKFESEDIKEKQKIRLAGLLHDVGHYPFSHTTEEANINICLLNLEPDLESILLMHVMQKYIAEIGIKAASVQKEIVRDDLMFNFTPHLQSMLKY